MSVELPEALTSAIGEMDAEIGGLRMTRLTSAVAVGATTFPVETTLDWPTAGRVSIDGLVYRYTGKTSTTLTGVTHVIAGASTPGAMKAHRKQSTVLDLSRTYNALDQLRRAFLVEYAEGDDLTALGRNLGVLRLPFLESDDDYRKLIKAIAYNPRGTLYGLQLALDALMGAGNYTIYEDLISDPCKVFIQLDGAAFLDDEPAGKTYLASREPRPAASNTTVTLASTPLKVGSVKFKNEELETITTTVKPTAQTIVEYDGGPSINAWTFIGTNEATQVSMQASNQGQMSFGTNAQALYRHLMRVVATSYTFIEAVLAPVTLPSTTDGRQFAISLFDTERFIVVGFLDSPTAGQCRVGFINGNTGAAFGGLNTTDIPRGSTGGHFKTYAIRKNSRNDVELYVDGVLWQTLAYSSFPVTVNHRVEVGVISTPGSVAVLMKRINIHSRTDTEFWNSSGAAGAVLAASPRQLDVNLAGHFVGGDVGKLLRISNSTALNAQNGNNSGLYEIETVDSDELVTLRGVQSTGAQVSGANPTRIIVSGNPDAFQFPDDLGKQIVITGSAVGNNGTYVIDKLLDPDTLTDLEAPATELRQKTNVCEVVAATFVAESNLTWRLLPQFVNESNLVWELYDAGSFAGTTVTLRQALPLATGGYTRILDVLTTNVLSAQLLAVQDAVNALISEGPPPTYEYYPAYLSDPLEFLKAYLDDLTAAGVVPEFSIE